jgi:hypothetical protein
LIKFIDARDDLSVQVHPDDNITDENGHPLGKTEMWYIIEADEGAELIYGLNDNITESDFAQMVANGDFASALKRVQVKSGECYFMPAGQVHAIGKGILLAEIQQNSDTTYRLYDYGRLDKDGKPRELHIEKALKVIKEGNIVNHDIGTINDQYFVYVAAIGTFTSVSYDTKQKNKKVLGRLAYVLNGLNDVINPSLFKVKLTTEDGSKYEIESPLVLVVNSISVGGIPFNKSGHLNDGKFDIIIVKKHIGKGLIAIFNTFILGVKRSKITKYYEIIRSSKFEFEIDDNITWALDGQRGMSGPVKIENKHNHLQIFVPFKYNKPKSKYLKNK